MLLKEDFKTHIYPELISAIDRDDENLIDDAIRYAEGLAKGYLSRFNISALFSASGADRDDLLLGLIKDIAWLQFAKLANVNMNLDFLIMNQDRAISELGKIQKGQLVPYGWPLASSPEGADSSFHVSSAPRRETSY